MTTTKPKQDAKKKRTKRKSTSPKPDTIVTFVIGGEPRLSPGGQRVWDVDVSMKRGEWGHITSYQTTSLNDSLLEAFNTLWSKAFSVELNGLPEFPDLSKVSAADVPKAAPAAASTKNEVHPEAEDAESEEEGETEDSDSLDGNAVEEELPLEQGEEPSHAQPQDFLDTSEDELTPEDAYAEEGDDDYYGALAEADPFAVPEAAAEFEGEYVPDDGAAFTGQEDTAEGDEDYGSLLDEYDLEWHDPNLTDEAADGNSTGSNSQISMF